MSKTAFVNGSVLQPAFVNSIFGSGPTGGHHHDDGNNDGSAPKIDLGSEVQNTLPWDNIVASGDHTHDGGLGSGHFGRVDLTTSVTGLLPITNLAISPLDRNFISGFHLQVQMNDWKDIWCDSGICADSSNSVLMQNTNLIMKNFINSPRTGGVVFSPTVGTVPSAINPSFGAKWYFVYLIGKAAPAGTNITTDVTIGVDTSNLATNLMADAGPSGYIYNRRIGAVLVTGTSGSYDSPGFFQGPDGLFLWTNSPEDATNITLNSSTYVNQTISVPPLTYDIMAKMIVKLTTGTGSNTFGAYIQGVSSVNTIKLTNINVVGFTSDHIITSVDAYASGTSTMGFKAVAGLGSTAPKMAVVTIGWIDHRGNRRQ